MLPDPPYRACYLLGMTPYLHAVSIPAVRSRYAFVTNEIDIAA